MSKEEISLHGQLTATWWFKDPDFFHTVAPPSLPHLLLQPLPGWRTLLFLSYLIPCWEIVTGSFAGWLHPSDHCLPRKGKQILVIKSHFCQRVKNTHYLILMSTSIWIKGVIFLWHVRGCWLSLKSILLFFYYIRALEFNWVHGLPH